MFHVCAYDRMFGRIVTWATFGNEKDADKYTINLRKRGYLSWCEKSDVEPFPTPADLILN